MNRFLGVLLVGLIAAIAVPAAVLASQPNSATVAKKKKTYCQKTGASIKAKLRGKSHGFYAFVEKNGYGILICQDKPKFTGEFTMDKGDTISTLRVSAKKCAALQVTGKAHNPQVFLFTFSDFLANNAQAAIYEAGRGSGATAVLFQVALSSNCVVAFGQRVGGVPQVVIKGTSAFGYTAELSQPVSASMTDKELAGVKISGSGATATASWTDAGVAKSATYSKPAGF